MKLYILFIATLFLSISPVSAQLCLNTAVSFNSDYDPFDLCHADFNRDGFEDIAIANRNGTNIIVLLGDGLGNLGAPTSFGGLIGYVNAIISADFNGDTIPDLAATNYYNGNNKVSILLGDGLGNFGTPNNITVGQDPIALVSSDFNMDGNADIAVVNNGSYNLSVFLGNGAGGFGSQTIVFSGFYIFGAINSIIATDFNTDSIPDLAVATTNASGGFNGVQILIGNGNGGFAMATNFACTRPFSITTNDFNDDSFADIATVTTNINSGQSVISVLLGNGAGSLSNADTFVVSSNPYTTSLISEDLNADGFIDLVTGNNGVGNLAVLLGNGAGSFSTPTNFTSGYGTYDMLSADFNGDGKKDLAVGNQNGQNKVSILLNCSGPTNLNYVDLSNNSIFIYPNPTSANIVVSNIKGKTNIYLYDELGRMLLEKETYENITIDISSMNKGVYTIMTEDCKGRSFNKIIITR
jgi:hypothetical protein